MDYTYVGFLAGALTSLAQFPQAFKVIKTKDTHSISLNMYLIMTLGMGMWFTYGVLIHDWPMILANGTGLVPSLFILYMTFKDSKIKKS